MQKANVLISKSDSRMKNAGTKKAPFQGLCGVPGATRTPGLPLRRRSLYPTELREHGLWGVAQGECTSSAKEVPGIKLFPDINQNYGKPKLTARDLFPLGCRPVTMRCVMKASVPGMRGSGRQALGTRAASARTAGIPWACTAGAARRSSGRRSG